MELSPESVKKYQELYRKRFGKEISQEKAYEEGMKLIRLMKVIYRPIKKNFKDSRNENRD